jgi:membrane dipeptidase
MMTEKEAKRLYDEILVIDGLNVSNWDSPSVFQNLRDGGVSAINATIATWENFTQTLDHISAWQPRFEQYASMVTQAKTVDDILEAKKNGKTGVIFGFQNASPVENHLDRFAIFYELGVRIIQLTYHERNLLGNGCYERRDDGVSNFGVDAIKEMNQLGILIDLSHVGIRTTMETIELSEKPVAFTHANAKSYYDVPRNKTDDALKLLAEKGGVVGSTCITTFLKTRFKSTITDYIDAIEHMVDLIGIDHVGIGTDYTQDQPVEFWTYIASQQGTKYPSTFSNPSTKPWEKTIYPIGLETTDKLPLLVPGLVDRGYGTGDIAKLIGGNWMRLFGEVWAK